MKLSASFFNKEQIHTGIPDSDCPSFWEILIYLFSIIFSVGVIGYIHLGMSVRYGGEVPLHAIVVSIMFIFVIVYSMVKLVLRLFPACKTFCPVCSLLARVMEIDQVTCRYER